VGRTKEVKKVRRWAKRGLRPVEVGGKEAIRQEVKKLGSWEDVKG
jgi:hypothetical protein